MKPPKTVMFFTNGNTAAFDEKGRQMSSIQTPWILLYVEFLRSKGIKDVESISFEMPDTTKATLFKTETGFNWRMK